MTELYSHSRLKCFETCAKQFHFRYVLKLPQETEGIEAFVGKRVHEVLERLYVFVRQEMLPSLPQVQRRYELSWEAAYDPERVKIVKQGTPLSFYRELGARCLEFYYRRNYPFDAGETLGIEERVEFDLGTEPNTGSDTEAKAGAYRMQGIIDRISKTPSGTIEIIDYKTGNYVPNQKALDEDRQLALYQLGLADRWEADQPIELVWHYVARGVVRRSTRTPEQLCELRSRTIELIDRIRVEEEYKPTKTALCSWCEFKSLCPVWNPEGRPADPAAPTRTPREHSAKLPKLDPEQLSLL